MTPTKARILVAVATVLLAIGCTEDTVGDDFNRRVFEVVGD